MNRAIACVSAAFLLASCSTWTPSADGGDPPRSVATPTTSAQQGGSGAGGQDSMGSGPQDYTPDSMWERYHGEFLRNHQRRRPGWEASGDTAPESSLDGEPGSFDLIRYHVQGTEEIPTAPDTALLLGLEFHGRHYNFRSSVPTMPDETVYGAGLRLGLAHFVDDGFQLYGVFEPGVYSDFDDNPKSKDYGWYGEAGAIWDQGGGLYFKLGVRTDETYEDLPVYPVLGLGWQIDSEWRLDLRLPLEAELSWSPDQQFYVYGGLEVEGDTYRIHDPGPGGGEIPYDVRVQEVRAMVGVEYLLNDDFSLFAEGGANLFGNYEWRNAVGTTYDGDLEPGIFLQAGIGFDF